MINHAGVTFATTAQAAAAVGVGPHLIRDWARRGLLRPAGVASGRPLYRLDDVYDAERGTRRRAVGRKRLTRTAS